MPAFTTALLAGGKSTRMGQDKAVLPLPSGELLWQRQWRVLQALQPAEMFWSGFARTGLPPEAMVLPDAQENGGPLAGLTACLRVCSTDGLLVLAVDLPHMSADYLQRLLAKAQTNQGLVPLREGYYEPLTAIYPKFILPLAESHLHSGIFSLQKLVQVGVDSGLLLPHVVSGEENHLFHNLNRPSDYLSVRPGY